MGGKAGGSGSNGPANTILSGDIHEFVLGLCEGEIVGLEDGARSIYVDGTSLINTDGTQNFKKFAWSLYVGADENEQIVPYLGSAADGATSSVTINTSLAQTDLTQVPPVDNRLVHTTTKTNIDFIDVRLYFRSLYANGGSGPGTARFAIEYKPTTSTTWAYYNNVEVLTFSEKITTGYLKEFRIPVTRINGQYDVRVTLLSKTNDTKNFVSIQWESIEQVQVGPIALHGVASLWCMITATNQYSGSAEVYGIYKGLKLKIPVATHYNPDTRVYTGSWNGLLTDGWVDNPAWALYALIMNDRFGIRVYQKHTSMNKWSTYEAARWCDELVTNPDNTTQPRFTFNMLISESHGTIDLLRYIAGSFNAVPVEDGNGNLTLRVDRANDPVVMLFCPENVVDGRFDVSTTDLVSQYNRVTVNFSNAALAYAQDKVMVENTTHQAVHGIIPTEIAAVGCTNYNEAVRRAKYRLITATTEIMLITFKTNRLGLMLQPFDLFYVCDEKFGFGSSGRIVSKIDQYSLQLDNEVYLENGVTYQLKVQVTNSNYPKENQYPTDLAPITIVTFTVSNAIRGSTSVIQVTTSLDAYDLPDKTTWVLSGDVNHTSNNYGTPKVFRVIKIDEVEGDHDNIEIQGVEVNRTKWSQIDDIGTINVNTRTKIFKGVVKPPKNLNLQHIRSKSTTGWESKLVVTWKPSETTFVDYYKVVVKRNKDVVGSAEVRGTSFTQALTKLGAYTVTVAAVSSFKKESLPLKGSVNLGTKDALLVTTPTGLKVL